MDKVIQLSAKKRDLEKKADEYRAEGFIPAVCYGSGKENTSVQLEYQEFRKAYIKAGDNTIIELDIEGAKHPVLVHEVQFHPVKGTIQHVDFLFVDMTKKVDTNVPVTIFGESPVVKNMAGVVSQPLTELNVRCLPGNIPHEFKLDISVVEDFHTVLHVSDLDIPKGVEVLDSLDLMVVTVTQPRKEEVELTPDEAEAEALASQETENGAETESEEAAE